MTDEEFLNGEILKKKKEVSELLEEIRNMESILNPNKSKMMLDYINHDERQKWVGALFLIDLLEKLITSKVKYGDNVISKLKETQNAMLEAADELKAKYPKAFQTLVNELNQYDMLFVSKDQSRKHYDKFIDREILNAIGDPLEQLYEILDHIFPFSCKGCCSVGCECSLNKIFTRYNIPCLDANDKLCQYRY